MANFQYKARDSFGRLISGEIVSSDRDEAAKKLKELGYYPLTLSAVRDLVPKDILKKFKRIKLVDVSTFTRQLYSLQKAGLPLLSAIDAISQQTVNRYFKLILEEIERDIRGGLSLSDALKKHPEIFDEVYVSMIKAAEAGGLMVEILDRLSMLIEQEIDTRSRIKSSTQYPMIAFFVLCAGFLILVTFVIPRFADIYGQFKVPLPLPTRMLIAVNVAIKKFWYLIIPGGAGAIFAFRSFIHSQSGRPIWDNFKLRVPVFGPLVSMLMMARFARITATLMKSAVPILEILDLVANASDNIIIDRAIISLKQGVSEGKGMSEPMKVNNLFPPAVVQMVAIGEQAGKVDELLFGVADYYEREAGYMIKNLTAYIEPILVFVLAIMVLIMALGIFMPMWNLIKAFRPM